MSNPKKEDLFKHLSPKAREIMQHIQDKGELEFWIEVAKNFISVAVPKEKSD